jgi:cobalamin biosynthesis Mg chelatase CobN
MNGSAAKGGGASASDENDPFSRVASIDDSLAHLLSNLRATESRLEYLEAVLEERIHEARALRRALEEAGEVQIEGTRPSEPSSARQRRDSPAREDSPAERPVSEPPTGHPAPSPGTAADSHQMTLDGSEARSRDPARPSRTDPTWILATVIFIAAVVVLVLFIATH